MIHRGSYRPYIAHTLDPCRGSEGHAFVALLAETRLTENTKKGICSLIGDARRGLRVSVRSRPRRRAVWGSTSVHKGMMWTLCGVNSSSRSLVTLDQVR